MTNMPPQPYAKVTVTVEIPGEPRLVHEYPRCSRVSYEHTNIPAFDTPRVLADRSLAPAPLGVECKLALVEFVAARDPEEHSIYTLTTGQVVTEQSPPG